MDDLLAGYRRFRQTDWPARRTAYAHLAEKGQHPRALVIACSDSRLDPSLIFGAAPGELFIVRNVASLVPPYKPDEYAHGTSSAIEYAVRALEVPNIVVMGHAQCGGVATLLDGTPPALGDFVAPWMGIAGPVRDRLPPEIAADRNTARRWCEHETVRLSLANLRGFPWIAEREAAGTIALHGTYYGIATGVLELLGEDGTFAPVAEAA